MTKQVLFLCTGNYYRSRFAELLFNALVVRWGLNWRAISRGIATELGYANIGPIATSVLDGLSARGFQPPDPPRHPLQLQEPDLAQADLVIALDEREHRPMLARRFPGWADQVEYWQVPDLGGLASQAALAEIEHQVQALLLRLNGPADG
jgi:protein-tyrosine phosphatase